MTSHVRAFSVSLLAVSISLLAALSCPKSAYAQEQSIFSAEETSVDKPVSLPGPAIEAVRLSVEAGSDKINVRNLLASAIHLDGDRESDLIVIGAGGLRGPHDVLFWVLQKTSNGFAVILSARGAGLKVLPTKSKDHRIIEIYELAGAVAQTITYRFEGAHYRRVQPTR